MTDGPIVRRRRVALEIKRCRESAGMTQEQVRNHFEWHPTKLSRMETARTSVTPRDLRDLFALYRVGDQDYKEGLLTLARHAKQRTWWVSYRDIMRPGNFIGLEADATAFREWAPSVVPGLLQTTSYMRAIMQCGLPETTPDELERHIELRTKRQVRLTSDYPLHLTAIVDEAVLYRVIGTSKTMAQQMEHLLVMSEVSTINLQILGLDAGAHFLLSGPAVLLEFPDDSELDVVFLEGVAGEYYEESPTEVAHYRRVFERLSASAMNLQESRKLITAALQKHAS